ncbi:glycosyltransferase [Isoptericola sp. b490]|uniref:glycosyltransferase family 2 protein n=1 Tax=Actinotalea lenta TaxID=3064654 RepID=UPI002713D59E|nr:glycosyltransferase [Isoptericola sp. b490]MDO8119963.1 glycosyltransferase [Isoptericola sp. b490]
MTHPVISLLLGPGRAQDVTTTLSTVRASARQVEVLGPRTPDASTADELAAALARASGRYVGVLEPGDLVEPGVLEAAVTYLTRHPDVDVLYTDEQWPGEGASGIFTKPDWNPAYHVALGYLGRLCLVRRELLQDAGGFLSGTEGVEERDAQLRVIERGATVEHLPLVGVSRPHAPQPDPTACVAAVERHLRRTGVDARVEAAEPPGGVRVRRAVPEPPTVSVVIPTAGTSREVRGERVRLVTRCVRSLVATTDYPSWDVVLVTSEGTPPEAVDEVRAEAGDRLTVTHVAGDFNFSRSINEGVRVASGELVLLLNDDTEADDPSWLRQMVAVEADPSVGVVGAKLVFADGRVQHLGVMHNDVWEPSHPFMFETDGTGHFGMGSLDLDYPAVTGACLLTSRRLFVDVGGLCTALPLNYNDVDFCFKVRAAGRRVVVAPSVRLFHYESASRTARVEQAERDFMVAHWRAEAYRDPFVQLRSVR